MTKVSTQFGSETVQLMAGYSNVANGLSGSAVASGYENQRPVTLEQENIGISNLLDMSYETLVFKEGEDIFKEGEATRGLYVLKSGCVKIFVSRESQRGRTTSPEYVTKLVSPGELFGYKSLVSQQKNKSFAKAVKTSTVWFYKTEAVMKLLSQAHPLVKTMLEQAVMDIQNYEKVSQLHYLASVQERIAFQIVSLADRFGVETPRGISLNLKLTRNEFAQLASTINESLSRHLTEFKNEGLIDINGKEIIIKNREGLAAKSGVFKV